MKRIMIFMVFFMLISCINRTVDPEAEEVYDRNQFFTIDYETILEQKEEVKLSDISKEVEYVRLETNEACLLRTTSDYFFTDEYIFVENVSHILMFDRKGKFIRQIGKPGRGPGEIGIIRWLSVLDSEKILVAQTNWARKLYYFSYEGEFLKSVTVPDISKIKILPGGRQLFFSSCAWGKEDYMFALRNGNGDTTAVVKNHYKWENKSGFVGTVSYHLYTPFYDYNRTTSLKSMYNDTVYHIRGDSIVPEYLLNLGKYELPEENRIEVAGGYFEAFRVNCKGYRFGVSFEANEKLFISSAEYSDEEEGNQWNMIYDRRSGKGNLVVNALGKPGMIINDIDGGNDFWPRGNVNDSTVYMPILPYMIIEGQNIDRFAGKQALDPEKKREFLEMIKSARENDNPILMVVKLKQTVI